ncbi:SbcC/MukB-like Walker B domain-containing protein [Desulfobacula phenolica]|uniref:Exonuclease SbcC n=1 Tax=Desulfobacula phenolica TaxID=90732 RepID=A0A1H2IMW5_9BACT|nr:SbcC/MukB-like Walker B domain-containing protein [Desulfobacula phenolica]SDU45188.1 exonuclease SbcC [Desulfobacula phenolica]
MKILELRFKNLNSLYGEWVIDFTSAEYALDKIFAITGPTGAGKSTILDAICLALYSRTPRLKGINKSNNEIMSRQTGECFAEVTFETITGQFKCHWSQRKAYQKADGNLLDSKHEVSDAISGRILESKKRDVAARIETITGMDFEQFTRSMLLAQGGFAAFLAAGPDQRGPILEQITGTGVYSDISKQVHERNSAEHNKLRVLMAKTEGISLLSDEDESCLHQELSRNQAAEKTLGLKNDQLGKTILWLLEIDKLKNELTGINEESENLSGEIKAFGNDKKRLEMARKAASLDSEYATLLSKRQQQQDDFKILTDAKTRIPDIEKILGLKQTDLKAAETAVTKVKEEQKEGLLLIKKVRAVDLLLSEKQSVVNTVESDCRKIKQQVSEKQDQQQSARADQALAVKDLSLINTYLSANVRDAELVTHLTGLIEQVKNLKTFMAAITVITEQVLKGKKQLKTDMARHDKQAAACRNLKKKHEDAVKQVANTQHKIKTLLDGRLLREYRAEHDGFLREMAYLRTIKNFEDERSKLEDGKACPLCGSCDHPFAKGNIPKIDEIEEKINNLSCLIKKAEQLENSLKTQESKEKTAGMNWAEEEKQLVLDLHKKDESQAYILRLENELQAASKNCNEVRQKLVSNLAPLGISSIPEKGPDAILVSLKARQKKWQDHQNQKIEIEKKNNDLTAKIATLDALMKTLEEDLKEKQSVLEARKKECEALGLERSQLYGQKNPDTEEALLENRVVETEKSAKAARQSRDKTKQQLNELNTRITAVKESTAARKPELDHLEISFMAGCKQAGFDDEPMFVSHRLSVEEKSRLSQRAEELDKKKTDLAARKKDREARLLREQTMKITDLPLDHLKKEQYQIRESLKKLGEQIGAIKQKLSDNTKAKNRLQQKIILIDDQKTECERWQALHALIGSADGKKYRNFAQGLTFEVMVSHANRQLEKMTDRYLLVRDKKQPLELNIVDNYQAGEIRSTKNLSGGESFIVSLSLALGLSNMAGRNVRVDSLFLDEGFGTLDEDALETSLEALSGLQQEGKLIGIISHVPALKERIGTQINITPVSGGKSTITGPGCKALAG